ncbi:MAG: hypothetical protein H7A47_01010 [Verrucomicrobiales bacterium]|nr:hypothetical protein [Verrucomicrobiales bacterium]
MTSTECKTKGVEALMGPDSPFQFTPEQAARIVDAIEALESVPEDVRDEVTARVDRLCVDYGEDMSPTLVKKAHAHILLADRLYEAAPDLDPERIRELLPALLKVLECCSRSGPPDPPRPEEERRSLRENL